MYHPYVWVEGNLPTTNNAHERRTESQPSRWLAHSLPFAKRGSPLTIRARRVAFSNATRTPVIHIRTHGDGSLDGAQCHGL